MELTYILVELIHLICQLVNQIFMFDNRKGKGFQEYFVIHIEEQ